VPLPNPSTLEEMKVSTSLYDASQEARAGGGTRAGYQSGSKDFPTGKVLQHRTTRLTPMNGSAIQSRFEGQARSLLAKPSLEARQRSGPKWGFLVLHYQGVRARNGLASERIALTPTIQRSLLNSDGTTSAALLASGNGTIPGSV